MEAAKRKGDWNRMSELQYGKIPQLETQIKKAEKAPADGAKPKLTAAGKYSATLDRPDGPTCKVTARFPGDQDYKSKTVTKTFAC